MYLSSNPEDSVMERRALRESVFPRLRVHCKHTLGLDLRVIDPYECSDPTKWPDHSSRQQLIDECRESSVGPFLLALVGNQYGSGCLPVKVEVEEFQQLLHACQQAGVSTCVLEEAYVRDENTTPASYCLQKEVEERMNDEQEELRRVFYTAVSRCVLDGILTPDRAVSYYRSALDTDLRFALENCSAGMEGRCLVYVHKVINVLSQREWGAQQEIHKDTQPQAFPPSQSSTLLHDPEIMPPADLLMSQLCDNFLSDLITSCKLTVYTMTTKCDRRHGYTSARRRTYTECLCQQVHADVLGLIESAVTLETTDVSSPCYDVLAREPAEQEELGRALSRLYDITRPEENEVKSYVVKTDSQCPLVITGGPCTGKTVLLAHCAQQMKTWLADRCPVVIPYFTNLSISSSVRHLLCILCCQIAHSYRHPADRIPEADPGLTRSPPSTVEPAVEHGVEPDCSPGPMLCPGPGASLVQLKEHLASLLSRLPSHQRPVILLLDGLDQTDSDHGNQVIQCLPSPLPPGVKVILAISPKRALALDAVQLHYPRCIWPPRVSEGEGSAGQLCVELGSVERKHLGRMLAALLRGSGRRITSGQQVLVNQALGSCCLPLYCHLLHAHTSLWSSASDVCESWLPDSVHASISLLLDHLEQKHGYNLVCRSLSYLTLSRAGLAEAELSDLLSSDDEVLVGYMHPDGPALSRMRVPEVDVERLLLDLKQFLVRRTVAGAHVVFWASRHFRLVVAKRYLVSHERRMEIHSAMADYFSSQWAFGIAKPLSQHAGPSIATAEVSTAAKTEMYIDRQAMSQPFILKPVDPSPPAYSAGRVNTRTVLELPYHVRESGRWEELACRFMMSLEFHQAMVRVGLLVDLVAMLEGREGWDQLPSPRERALLASILKTGACFLRSSPLELPAVMETNLLPYLACYPRLESYTDEITLERRLRGGGIGVMLCPAPSAVPSTQWTTRTEESSVVAAAGTECGVVVGVLADGSAWVWKHSQGEVLELLLSCQQKQLTFVSVKSGGRCILLSTHCHKLLLWDVTGPEIFLEVKIPLRTELTPESDLQLARVAGSAACQEKACIWWKDQGLVSVYDLCNGESVTPIQCESSVSCLVCSSDGRYIYCGQESGAVSIFDLNTGGLIGSCSNSHQSAVKAVILCEDEKEMASVDVAGNITVWNVAGKTDPPSLVKECLSRSDDPCVLSVDYSAEMNNLLVCKAHQISVWDTCDWTLWDQFLAPAGRAFLQAVLVQEGHHFLAALESCSLVLMWSFISGECVLSLDTGTKVQLFMLLKMASDIVSITKNGRLTLWGSELICAAGTAPKMSCAVQDIVVEPAGEKFYTIDGSETVWRWSLQEGMPDAHFVHDGPVVKLCLSQDGHHLVTLSGQDVYVWQAETGQNTLRIRGSGITDVLVAPNGNCGVSLSEMGLTQVWKLASGAVVCRIHLHLAGARVSPQSTFLIGCHRGDLLAASLWCGSISKRFSCADHSEHVVAFDTLPDHPDYVLVMAASGAVYTWRIAEETLCRHLQLPYTFRCCPQEFHASSDGAYALLSTDDDVITMLDLSQARLCSVRAEGRVTQARLDERGRYVVYACVPPAPDAACVCKMHTKPLLGVVRLADGGRVERLRLPKTPSALLWWDQLCVCVGFNDGSVGLYAISDGVVNEVGSDRGSECFIGQEKKCHCDRAPLRWLPLETANITWK